MDLYSEEFTLELENVEVDSNQEKHENSDKVIASEVISKNILTLNKDNQEENPQSIKYGSQAYGEQYNIIPKNVYVNEIASSETDINSEKKESEEINLPEKSENCDTSQITNESSTEDLIHVIINKSEESVGPKRRGRRRKEELRELKPTRGSTRKRKCATYLEYNNDKNRRRLWTVEEKKQLLKALEEFGADNIKDISSQIPTKSERAIYNQIRVYSELGKDNLQYKLHNRKKRKAFSQNISRLTEWCQRFEEFANKTPQRLFALSNVFILIAEYGKFPKPSECDGIDFRAMYRYLHCMMNGKPYYGINRKTADILLQCLTNVMRYLKSKPRLGQLLPLLLLELKVKPVKTYSKAHKKPFHPSNLEKDNTFLKIPGLNPLNIPNHLLLKDDSDVEGFSSSQIVDSSDDDDLEEDDDEHNDDDDDDDE